MDKIMRKDVSTLSKVFKSAGHKRKASERTKANGVLRASLHSQKANTTNTDARAGIQRQIDAIGAGKAV
jgi:hypothetical protein